MIVCDALIKLSIANMIRCNDAIDLVLIVRVAVLAEIPLRSPRNYLFFISKYIFIGSKYHCDIQNYNNLILKRTSLLIHTLGLLKDSAKLGQVLHPRNPTLL